MEREEQVVQDEKWVPIPGLPPGDVAVLVQYNDQYTVVGYPNFDSMQKDPAKLFKKIRFAFERADILKGCQEQGHPATHHSVFTDELIPCGDCSKGFYRDQRAKQQDAAPA